MVVSGQLHGRANLFLPYPWNRTVAGPENQSGLVEEGENFLYGERGDGSSVEQEVA